MILGWIGFLPLEPWVWAQAVPLFFLGLGLGHTHTTPGLVLPFELLLFGLSHSPFSKEPCHSISSVDNTIVYMLAPVCPATRELGEDHSGSLKGQATLYQWLCLSKLEFWLNYRKGLAREWLQWSCDFWDLTSNENVRFTKAWVDELESHHSS